MRIIRELEEGEYIARLNVHQRDAVQTQSLELVRLPYFETDYIYVPITEIWMGSRATRELAQFLRENL